VRSWGVYEEPLRTAIHRLKYNSDIGLAEIFSDYMVSDIKKLGWDFDMIVPVPLAKERKKERGYNQAAILARLIALNLKKTFNSVGLKRIRHTVSQTRLSADERRKNVENAFSASSEIIRDNSILLIDDLATTCATLEACTHTLYGAGAKTVYSFTLARTL
jgi:ComF family protein